MMTMKKAIKHFKLIYKHKLEVYRACAKAGIWWRGVKHDFSKFSPTEFCESIKYYTGNRSPIDNCKDINGYSMAWLHHRGRNSHHWEYWIDDFSKGMSAILMPLDDCLEMLCDFIGAGKAYLKDKFTWDKEYEWWCGKRYEVIMHPVVWYFIDKMLYEFKKNNSDRTLNYRRCKILYVNLTSQYTRGELNNSLVED